MKGMKKYWPSVVAVMALVLVLTAALPVGVAQGNKDKDNKGNGSNGNPGVIPLNASPRGMTYAEWSAEYWRWQLELPLSAIPPSCPDPPDLGQSGNVWFLLSSVCDFTIPPGTALFFGLISVECSSLEEGSYLEGGFHGDTAEEQRTCAKFWTDHIVVDSLFAEIDGVPMKNLELYRFVSPQFEFEAPTPWIGGPVGGKGTAVADGYYLFLHPLPKGTHTLRFGGAAHLSVAEGDPIDLDFTIVSSPRVTVGH